MFFAKNRCSDYVDKGIRSEDITFKFKLDWSWNQLQLNFIKQLSVLIKSAEADMKYFMQKKYALGRGFPFSMSIVQGYTTVLNILEDTKIAYGSLLWDLTYLKKTVCSTIM